MADIGSAYAEHTRGMAERSLRNVAEKNKLLEQEEPDSVLTEAIQCSDPMEKCRKLMIYLIHKGQLSDEPVSAAEARKVAHEFLASNGHSTLKDILIKVKSSQDSITHTTENDEQLPLGQFAFVSSRKSQTCQFHLRMSV